MRSNLKKKMMLFLLVVCLASLTQAGTVMAKNVKLRKDNVHVLALGSSYGTVKWSTSNKKVVGIIYQDNTRAVIRAKKKGSAKITAKTGKTSYTCKVTVTTGSGIPKKLTVLVGDKVSFKQNAKKGKWSSSDKSIASASGKAVSKKVTFRKAGTVKITEKIGKKSYKCTVTVLNKNGTVAGSGTQTGQNSKPNTTQVGGDKPATDENIANTGNENQNSTNQTQPNPTPSKPTYIKEETDLEFPTSTVTVTLGETVTLNIKKGQLRYVWSDGRVETFDRSFRYSSESVIPNCVDVGIKDSTCTITAHKDCSDSLNLPHYGTLALKSTNGKVYKCQVIVNDWGVPDRKLLDDWMNDILNKCSGKNHLDTLTNITKYIASTYPYRAGNPTVLGYVEGYVEKHGWGAPGADCIGSSEAIERFAHKLGLEARVSDYGEAVANNPTHVRAFVKIGDKEYAFDCGLVGPAGRGWIVFDRATKIAVAGDSKADWLTLVYGDRDYRDPNYY